jgi:hypothetical protein
MSADSERMRRTRLWASWKSEPCAQRWSPSQETQAKRLLDLAMAAESVVNVREQRMLFRELRTGEAKLGLGKPVPDEEEPEVRPEPREVPLRVPDLSLLDDPCQFVHPSPAGNPSLGPQVVQWIEQHLCHGPGELRGKPAHVDDEWLAFITRAYEVFPQGHEYEGQRVFREVGYCKRKGSSKTECAAWLCIAEMHPSAPVRFDGWLDDGSPRGTGVVDPRIFLLATTEQQSSALTYSAFLAIVKESPTIRDDFRTTDGFAMLADGSGLCEPVTGSPNSRDGERTTLNIFDEGHRLVGERLAETVNVMTANLPKRRDSWAFMTTTGWEPGEDSFAESEDRRAREGNSDSQLYLHRQAKDGWTDVMAALEEASGPCMWERVDKRAALQEWEATRDRAYFERVHLCRSVTSSTQAFPMAKILDCVVTEPPSSLRRQAAPGYVISGASKPKIVLGFDGSIFRDHTVLTACTIDEPVYMFYLGVWKPQGVEVPVADVDAVLRQAFKDYDVKLFLGDPSGWADQFSVWAGDRRIGKVVKAFKKDTGTPDAMRNFIGAIEQGKVSFDGNPDLLAELSNARTKKLPGVFPDGSDRATMKKGQDRTKKIDGAMSLTIAFEARRLAIAKGAGKQSGSAVHLY